MTDGQLRSKRDEFWDTAPAFEGRKEIWDALKAAAYAAEANDHELAQAILDGASITLPHGEPWAEGSVVLVGVGQGREGWGLTGDGARSDGRPFGAAPRSGDMWQVHRRLREGYEETLQCDRSKPGGTWAGLLGGSLCGRWVEASTSSPISRPQDCVKPRV